MALHPVILAGGSGTRLWPLSREYFPKPFLSVTGQRSMFQETVGRLNGVAGAADPIVVCNEEHRFLVAEHAREIGRSVSSIILEPVGRNTAPALTLAALALADASLSPHSNDPVILVLPADHVIRDVPTFQRAVLRGASLADSGCLVTFGIVPTSPQIGYGYIKKGRSFETTGTDEPGVTGNDAESVPAGAAAFWLDAFVEKPDTATAAKMLDSEEYLWNSGMFMMRVSVWLEQLERYRPDITTACRTAHDRGRRDGDFSRPDRDAFIACPSDTIDYAVMEKVAAHTEARMRSSPQCVVVPLDAGWSDIGSWSAILEEGPRDEQGNVIHGNVYTHSMRDSLLVGQHRLVTAVGLSNAIVVETADAVLVADKDHVDDVKALVAQLKAEHRSEQENHRKVHRPWGSYETVDSGPHFQVKRLTVNPGAALSLQLHHRRAEHWIVVKGRAKVTRGDEEFFLDENESTNVPVGAKHRLENPGATPLEIIEVQSGSYLGEDDIVRLDDRYNRHMESVGPSDGPELHDAEN